MEIWNRVLTYSELGFWKKTVKEYTVKWSGTLRPLRRRKKRRKKAMRDNEEVNEEAIQVAALQPQAPLPCTCRYRSLRHYLVTCGLFGCCLPMIVDSAYSVLNTNKRHYFSRQAVPFKCFDGFSDMEATCCIFFLNKVRNIDIGVPTLENASIFTKLPWEQPDVFRECLVIV
ncbi:unnamed protein product [Microthlaspi erraticum]|uniref:Uncharacterized protein n=1 Tax=Microthlaspi erraticum TaxID=1685480 RepID=A0A6D2K7H3_9BRAS|nr:unnamed protein product [Microthlaspi erraticum]